jgi:hypothetical protein
MLCTRLIAIVLLATPLASPLIAQTIQPVIVQYEGRGEGKFTVTNGTLAPMVVVIEPQSFSIDPDGKARFRPLDAGIHLELSAMSINLVPQQSAYVFYKVSADRLPAWFTIYSTFSAPKHGPGIDLRIMLPHTVYLYQKQRLDPASVHIGDIVYHPGSGKIVCDLENSSPDLGRIEEVDATSHRGSTTEAGGFPLLPGSPRHLEMDWKEKTPPESVVFHFDHSTVKRPVIPAPVVPPPVTQSVK